MEVVISKRLMRRVSLFEFVGIYCIRLHRGSCAQHGEFGGFELSGLDLAM